MHTAKAPRTRLALAALTITLVAPMAAVLALPQAAGAEVITTASLPGSTVGQPYTAQIEVSGGYPPPYDYIIADPVQSPLPPGLSLGESTGLISGTPGSPPVNQPTTYAFGVVLTNANTNEELASASLSITVTPAGYVAPPPLQMTSTSIPEATATKVYSFQMQAAGGTAPYTWSASGLPAGFTMSPSGAISGESDEPQQADVTVSAVDSGTVYDNGNGISSSEQQSVEHTFTFTVSSGVAAVDPAIFQLEAELSKAEALPSSVVAELVAEIQALYDKTINEVDTVLCYVPIVGFYVDGFGCGIL